MECMCMTSIQRRLEEGTNGDGRKGTVSFPFAHIHEATHNISVTMAS